MGNAENKIVTLSNELNKVYGNDPVGFIHQFFSFEGLKFDKLTDQQIEIATTFASRKHVAVAAGGGIGKTALTAMLIQWFLITHPYSKIPTTAPTSRQLHDALWAEIAFWLRRNKFKRFYDLQTKKLSIKGFREWFAVPRTVNKDKHELNDTLAGFHAPYMAIFVDEASGVPDPVFTALTGAMTDENAYIMLISNPVSYQGYFYDTIADPDGKGKEYAVLKYSSLDSPLVDKSYAEKVKIRYGENSSMYKAKVLGEALTLSSSCVVPPDLYDRIVGLNTSYVIHKDIVLGVDVGGEGDDATIICHKSGQSIIRWDEIQANDPDVLTNELVRIREKIYHDRHVTVIIDSVGLGWGPFYALQKLNKFPVVGFKGSEKSNKPDMYLNRRTEGYHHLSKIFHTLHFPVQPPEGLKKQLANLMFNYQSEPIKMEPKDQFVRRLHMSPNEADALMMACSENFFNTSIFYVNPSKVGRNLNRKLSVPSIEKQSYRFGKYSKFVT